MFIADEPLRESTLSRRRSPSLRSTLSHCDRVRRHLQSLRWLWLCESVCTVSLHCTVCVVHSSRTPLGKMGSEPCSTFSELTSGERSTRYSLDRFSVNARTAGEHVQRLPMERSTRAPQSRSSLAAHFLRHSIRWVPQWLFMVTFLLLVIFSQFGKAVFWNTSSELLE